MAEKTGRTKTFYAREAILEDLEDMYLATQRLQRPAKTYSAQDVKRELGLYYMFDERALKELKNLGHQARSDIPAYLDQRIVGDADPRRFGKGLKADLVGLWLYRVGDYRMVCQIKDRELLVLVVAVGNRKNVYE